MKKWINTGLLSASNLALALAQWVVVILIARTQDLETVGYYGLALAICSPVIIALSAEARSRIASGFSPDSDKQLLSIRLFLYLTLLPMASLAIYALIPDNGNSLIVIAVMAYKAIESFFDFPYGRMLRENSYRRIVQSQFCRAVFLIGSAVMGLYWANSLALVMFLATGLSAILLVSESWQNLSHVLEKLRYRSFLKTNKASIGNYLSLGKYAAFFSLLGSLPRLALGISGSLEAVGIFTICYQFVAAGSTITSSINQIFLSRLNRREPGTNDANHDLASLHKLLIETLAVSVVGVIAVFIAGPFIVESIFSAEFNNVRALLTSIMLGGVFAYLAVAVVTMFIGYGHFSSINRSVIMACATFLLAYITLCTLGVDTLTSAIISFVGSRVIHLATLLKIIRPSLFQAKQ